MRTAKSGPTETGSLKSSLSALAEAAGSGSRGMEPAAWTLPSGEDLLHYALNGGFLAPGILGSAEEQRPGRRADSRKGTRRTEGDGTGPRGALHSAPSSAHGRGSLQSHSEQSGEEVR